jgi:hypothetical protein
MILGWVRQECWLRRYISIWKASRTEIEMSSEKLEPEVGENNKAFKQVRLVRALDIGYAKYTYV